MAIDREVEMLMPRFRTYSLVRPLSGAMHAPKIYNGFRRHIPWDSTQQVKCGSQADIGERVVRRRQPRCAAIHSYFYYWEIFALKDDMMRSFASSSR